MIRLMWLHPPAMSRTGGASDLLIRAAAAYLVLLAVWLPETIRSRIVTQCGRRSRCTVSCPLAPP